MPHPPDDTVTRLESLALGITGRGLTDEQFDIVRAAINELRDLRSALKAEREECAKAVCPHCRSGVSLHADEWHEVTVRGLFGGADERRKVYCIATPIRSRPAPGTGEAT